MPTASYQQRRLQVAEYFDRTAADVWSRLTSDAPVGRVRATVRAGRDRMRQTLLGWLPDDLRGVRLLDAGCGTGALAVAAATRGASVVAIDLSPTLINLARQRVPPDLGPGRVEFHVGDMLEISGGRYDHVVSMDSLIHYPRGDAVGVLARLATQTAGTLLFTFAPRTPVLAIMHGIGRLFPCEDRAPAIEPVSEHTIRNLLAAEPRLRAWHPGRIARITNGFYVSQAMELVPA